MKRTLAKVVYNSITEVTGIFGVDLSCTDVRSCLSSFLKFQSPWWEVFESYLTYPWLEYPFTWWLTDVIQSERPSSSLNPTFPLFVEHVKFAKYLKSRRPTVTKSKYRNKKLDPWLWTFALLDNLVRVKNYHTSF